MLMAFIGSLRILKQIQKKNRELNILSWLIRLVFVQTEDFYWKNYQHPQVNMDICISHRLHSANRQTVRSYIISTMTCCCCCFYISFVLSWVSIRCMSIVILYYQHTIIMLIILDQVQHHYHFRYQARHISSNYISNWRAKQLLMNNHIQRLSRCFNVTK